MLVVFPKLRSDGYVLPSMRRTAAVGNAIDLKQRPDFEGYEKDYYDVAPGRDGRVQVHFSRAEVWENGKSHRRPEPSLTLFQRMTSARSVRLVYLVRESNADHDMAVVASADPQLLDRVTESVIQRATCEAPQSTSCIWVPKGVAVRQEISNRK